MPVLARSLDAEPLKSKFRLDMLLFLVFVHETVHEIVHEVANLGLKYRFFEYSPLFDRPIIALKEVYQYVAR